MKDEELLNNVLMFLRDIEIQIKKETVPICFHCGVPYIKDGKYCSLDHNTWKPDCNCLNKSTIRIVTGA